MSNTLIDGLIASTVFTPGVAPDACTSAYMRNCYGTVDPLVPDTIAAGQYLIVVPGNLDEQRISVTARAYNAAGDTRNVTVRFTNFLGGNCNVGIFVKNDAAADSEDFVNCEVTICRLPL